MFLVVVYFIFISFLTGTLITRPAEIHKVYFLMRRKIAASVSEGRLTASLLFYGLARSPVVAAVVATGVGVGVGMGVGWFGLAWLAEVSTMVRAFW